MVLRSMAVTCRERNHDGFCFTASAISLAVACYSVGDTISINGQAKFPVIQWYLVGLLAVEVIAQGVFGDLYDVIVFWSRLLTPLHLPTSYDHLFMQHQYILHKATRNRSWYE
ncbi:hypothetical protein F5B17DRAFT_11496 [Nemania serpens]|nr:hypothetical protein F5B17DRAFT_11496 [Nemania serpens]